MLKEEFLDPLGLSQTELAEQIGVPFQRINLIVNKRRGITPDTAYRLARYFGTTPEFWLNGQMIWEMYQAQHSPADREWEEIRPLERKAS
jgi:addiction module HigA family antidote